MDLKHGLKAEKKTAKRMGGTVVPGSGCGEYRKGDITHEDYLIENKSTLNRSLSLKLDWLLKIRQEAFEKIKIPALSIQFCDRSGNPARGGNWVMIPEDEFIDLIRKD